MKKHLAILTTHPIQYQIPWFRYLALQDWIEPHVFFGSRFGLDSYVDRDFGVSVAWDLPMLEGYSCEFLENCARKPSVDCFFGVNIPEIKSKIQVGQFDTVLVLGWHSYYFWQGFKATFKERIPLILRGESNLLAPRPVLKKILRQLCLRHLFRHTHAFLAIGTLNHQFYTAHGVSEERILNAPYFVDNSRFGRSIPKRDNVRKTFGVADSEILFLLSGKLISRKRPMDLLAAWDCLPSLSKKMSRVFFVGDGVLKAKLQQRASQCEFSDHIQFLGFRNQAEIADLYAACDAIVMPSDYGETWGLSVNEAMATGARAIVSDRVGCGPDLVIPGLTGEIFPCGDIPYLRGVLQRYIQDQEWIKAPLQRKAVLEHIAKFSMERATDALHEILLKINSR